MCIANNGKDTKHTRNISRIINLVRNDEEWNFQKTVWCEEAQVGSHWKQEC